MNTEASWALSGQHWVTGTALNLFTTKTNSYIGRVY